jgi:serine-type D-Ala-D-Ala carboxypeptidase (penicillin-binding protein 5/6)
VKIFFSCLFFYFLFSEVAHATPPFSAELSVPIAVLVNAKTGKVIFEKNGDLACFPASTTKLATALYVLHKNNISLDSVITASFDALATVSPALRRDSKKHPSYRLEQGGTHMGIKVGEEIPLRSLLYGAMLCSGNDATNVLAEATCGSIPKFIEELNEYLAQIGCTQTHFSNPHGLPDRTHVTTGKDLARIGYEATKFPVLKEIVSSTRWEKPATNKQPATWLVQTNGLLKQGKYYYPHATGMKTGYTEQAGFPLIASATKGDRDLIAVVCGCASLAQRYRSAVQLFEMAFNESKLTRKLLSKEHDIFHEEIKGAKNLLDAMLKEDANVSFYPSEEKVFHYTVHWFAKELPITPGEEVGVLQLLDQENSIEKTISLLAVKPVFPTFSYVMQKKKEAFAVYLRQYRTYLGYGFSILLLGGCIGRLHRKKIRGKVDKLLQR